MFTFVTALAASHAPLHLHHHDLPRVPSPFRGGGDLLLLFRQHQRSMAHIPVLFFSCGLRGFTSVTSQHVLPMTAELELAESRPKLSALAV